MCSLVSLLLEIYSSRTYYILFNCRLSLQTAVVLCRALQLNVKLQACLALYADEGCQGGVQNEGKQCQVNHSVPHH